MDSETFVEFLKSIYTFAESKRIPFQVLLFVGCHSDYVSLTVAKYCKEYKIIFIVSYLILHTFFKPVTLNFSVQCNQHGQHKSKNGRWKTLAGL